ncbi:MAG: pyruvate/oxaloacetate carboxyltransferase [Dethiobacteria bacterium]|jgi:oxaloacetate decarboxylase alpha subunit
MPRRKVGITDTTLRDAHQSLMATRMRVEEMLPIAAVMDQVGFHSMEVWGGATFDTCMRFLDEDPWERLRLLRQHLPNTKLQMLLRGQNLLGYSHYPDDVVEAFIRLSVKNGIDIIRIFDALNDIRNMELAMKIARDAGAHVQATICYTISPMHNISHFVELAGKLEQIGADSLCIKDMAGLIAPYDAFELVRKLKETLKIPIQLHSHFTSGMAAMSYLKAVEAGCDVVDTAVSALSLGSSQPATESFVAALRGTPYDTGLDLGLIGKVGEYFKGVRRNYDISQDIVLGVNTSVLNYQIPGGMISNLASQLAAQNAGHLMNDVLEEVPRVRKELGYPPLVTPSSQIVGTQAVMNVITGERYKVILKEVKNYLKGLYGKPPGQVDPDLQKKVLGDEKPFQGRPADLLEPRLEEARAEISTYLEKEEDLLSYVLFPQVALSFFQRRKGEAPPLQAGVGDPEKKETVPENNLLQSSQKINMEAIYAVDESLLYFEPEKKCYIYPSS